jgi:hypothetical protein
MSLSRGEDERAAPSPAAASVPTVSVTSNAAPTVAAGRGPALATDRVADVKTVAVVQDQTEARPASVAIIDVASGATLVARETSYNPLVTFRRSHEELLLTHRPLFEGMTGREHVLEVLDLRDLSTKRVIPIPGRPEYIVPGTNAWQALSNDERYFAVYAYEYRAERPECQLRPADGPSCTRSGVRVIDLDSSAPEEVLYELPRRCFGGIVPHGTSGFVATCADGYYLLEGGQPTVVSAGPEPRNLTDPVQARNLASAMFWLSPGDGWFGALMQEGSFVWSKSGQPEVSNKALPPGMQLRWPIFTEIGNGLLVAGYIERYYDQYPLGLAVFNLTTGQVEKTMPSFGIGRSMVAGGPDELLATTQDGRLIAITVSTGAERTLAQLPANAENAFLVR